MGSRLLLLVLAACGLAQAQSNMRNAAGLDKVIDALVSEFDHADIVALGDDHWRKADSDIRIRLVQHPEFVSKVSSIVVEFASTGQQAVLDRYIRGEDVPIAELRNVWRTTTQINGVWDSPVYAQFFAAVREVNRTLPEKMRLRVFAGDPPTGSDVPRDLSAFSVIKEQVLNKGRKALVIYGAAHLWRAYPTHQARLQNMLEPAAPGRVFVVIAKGGASEEYRTFERALKTPERPVLVQLDKQPFRDFPADEFFANDLKKLVNGQWVSAFQSTGITLGQMADAFIYLGMDPSVENRVLPNR
jgi:uncharacterized iron-regulated protein